MEELELKEFELNFLQLMGINYINGKFVNSEDNSEFTFSHFEPKAFDDEESTEIYKFTDNNNTIIELNRWYLCRGNLNGLNIKRNGFMYSIESEEGFYTNLTIKDLENEKESYIGYTINVESEPTNSAYIVTEITDGGLPKIHMLCSFDKIYTCASLIGNSIKNYGDELDYTAKKYEEVLKKEINKIENVDYKYFFMQTLPTLVKTHENMQNQSDRVYAYVKKSNSKARKA